MTARKQATTFQDLCTAGAPLAAIVRCLHSIRCCKDQLSLAQAVGKQYRDMVCREIVHLPAVTMPFAGRPAVDFRAAVNLTARLQNVQSVTSTYRGDEPYDVEGLMLLRLLPALEELCLTAPPPGVDHPGVCRSVAVLTTLKRLSLHQIEGDADACECAKLMAQLTQLSYLSMRGFQWDAEAMEHLAGLKGLRGLDISCADLSGVNLAPVINLTQLEAVHAQFDHEAVRHMCTLTALRELILEGCTLPFEGIQELGSLKALTRLSLAEQQVLDVDCISALSRLTKLEVLDVSFNSLGAAGAASLSLLSSLRELCCSGNELGAEGALHIGKCTQLTLLEIDNNGLGKLGAACLSGLVGLQELCISNNGICSDGAYHIARGLTSLTSLYLHGNVVGVAGAAVIARMAQLHVLAIHDNNLEEHSVQMLLASLPNLTATSRASLTRFLLAE